MNRQSFRRFPLTTIFAQEGHIRVLRVIALTEDGVGSEKLAEEVGMKPRGVGNTLSALLGSGIIEVIGDGKDRIYRLMHHDLANALRDFYRIEQLQFDDDLNELRRCLEAEPRAISAWVYGKTADRTDGPGDRVELAVVSRDADVKDMTEALRISIKATSRLAQEVFVAGFGLNELSKLRLAGDATWRYVCDPWIGLKGPSPADLEAGSH